MQGLPHVSAPGLSLAGGSIGGSILPSAANTYNLGSSPLSWNTVFCVSMTMVGGGFISSSLLAGESNATQVIRGAITAGGAGTDIALRAVNDRTAGKIVSIQDNNGSVEHAYWTWTGRMGMGLGGTALVAGDFALSSGFGATASVGSITATDVGGVFTVTAAGAGLAANPTVTLTFKDGAWPATPKMPLVCRAGGSQRTVPVEVVSISTTTLVIAFLGTPVAAETYSIRFIVIA